MEHVLTSAIGLGKDVDIYYFENIVREKDKILLCSDGLYHILKEEELAKMTNTMVIPKVWSIVCD